MPFAELNFTSCPVLPKFKTEFSMSPNDLYYRKHIFVCNNRRAAGHVRGCCAEKDSDRLRNYMKEKVKTLSEDQILDLLAKNGRLIKRPLVFNATKATIGFKEDDFKKNWS